MAFIAVGARYSHKAEKEITVSTVTDYSNSSDELGKPLQGNRIPKELNPSWPHYLKRVYLENVNPDCEMYGSELFWLLFLSVAEAVEKGEDY